MANHGRQNYRRQNRTAAQAMHQSRAAVLETFDNPHPQRDYVIETICPEFTSLCPKTGQPDFGTLTISYVPDRLCFELKSLKLYLQTYRDEGAFYEDVTNRILDDLVAATRPRSMQITAAFTPRGGIRTNVHVEYSPPG
jgi:7-cyano-7-deazaguanine reductase